MNHILTRFYSNQPNGLCGNDDCGQTSAWYVLSAMGFYPVNPASGEYVLGSPLAKRSEMNPGNGRRFTITAENLSKKNIYIQKATLMESPMISHISDTRISSAEGNWFCIWIEQPSETWGTAPENRPGSEVVTNHGNMKSTKMTIHSTHNNTVCPSWKHAMFAQLTPFCSAGNNKYGYKNAEGKEVVSPKYDLAYPFEEGMAAVRLAGKYGYLDGNGKEVVSPKI